MSETGLFVFCAGAIGLGATAFMDVWAAIQRRLFAVPGLDYALVGRWIGYLPRGRAVHANIAATAPLRGERLLGWGAHYAIGVAFAAVLLGLWGLDWARAPSLGPALAVGLATLAAPFLILQPGMGAGLAAARTPDPWVARRRSLVAHLAFGLGLYVAGLAVAPILPD